jgi:hypothetical protein
VVTPPQRPMLQRTCDCGEHTGGGECEDCKKKKKMPIQRHANGLAAPAIAPPIVHDVLRSPGRPLDAGTRAFFEPRFGHDFSQVRVHTDEHGAQSARAVGASAYTVGREIVFDTHHYSPDTTWGRRLLAHELTHVVQQGQRKASAPARVADSTEPEEHEAERVANAAVSGHCLGLVRVEAPMSVQRQAAKPRERILQLAESETVADRQQALDLIVSAYYQRPATLKAIVYDPAYRYQSPQEAETQGEVGAESQTIRIGAKFFLHFSERYEQRVRTIGHELQHVGQKSPEKGPGKRTVGSTLLGVGAGVLVGAALGGIGLGIAKLAGASLEGAAIGLVLGGGAALGGAVGGISDPFRRSERRGEPIRNQHTREFLAIYWTVTAEVPGLGQMELNQRITAITLRRTGALAEYGQMPPEDQRLHRRKYEELQILLEQLTRRRQQLRSAGDFPGPEPPKPKADVATV